MGVRYIGKYKTLISGPGFSVRLIEVSLYSLGGKWGGGGPKYIPPLIGIYIH